MDAMDAIMTRRSTRRMKPEIPERERMQRFPVPCGKSLPCTVFHKKDCNIAARMQRSGKSGDRIQQSIIFSGIGFRLIPCIADSDKKINIRLPVRSLLRVDSEE